MNRKTGIIINKRAYKWISFFIVSIISIIISSGSNKNFYQGESLWYWTFADKVFTSLFHITDFSDAARGYFFPFLIGFFKLIFRSWGWRILIALMNGVLFSFSLPCLLLKRAINSRMELLRTLLSFAVYTWFWNGFMQFPLPEFGTAFFLITAAAVICSLYSGKLSFGLLIAGISVGIMLYAAINTQILSLFGVIPLLLIFLLTGRNMLRKTAALLCSFLFGIVIAALPQCIINNHTTGSFSPIISTGETSIREIFEGIGISRSETYAGYDDFSPGEKLVFRDKIGEELIRRRNLSADNFTFSTFIKLFFEYPLDMAGVYIRHLISLMTPSFTKPFTTQIFIDKSLPVVFSILFWVIAVLGVCKLINEKRIFVNHYYGFAVLLPFLIQVFYIPRSISFFPVYLMCYYFVIFSINFKELVVSLKDKWILVVFGVMIIMLFWITAYADILGTNGFHTLIIRGA